MPPWQFWWLTETLAPPAKQGLGKAERDELVALLREAEEQEAAR